MENKLIHSNSSKKKLYVKPINICVKYDPPTLGIYYECVGDAQKRKKYIHQIKVSIKHDSNVNLIYDKLIRKEPHYFNQKYITQNQVIKQLDKIKKYLMIQETQKKNSINAKSEIIANENINEQDFALIE